MVMADEMARSKESLANAKHIEPQAFEQDPHGLLADSTLVD